MIVFFVLFCFFKDTGFFLTWFLACTLKKAGFTKASSIASLLLMKNQLSSMQWTKWTLSQTPLIIHKVRNLTSFYLSDMKYNQGPFGRILGSMALKNFFSAIPLITY